MWILTRDKAASFILEEMVNMMNPLAESAFEDSLKKLAGLPVPPKSAYGKPLTGAELEFARSVWDVAIP
jgi:hypothetical protein